jgi:two-component system nitrate/nitrite response regulator NarL
MTRVRVVVADDHPLFREAVGDAIRSRPDLELVDTVADGRAALESIREHLPDVAVLDVRMPELEGPQVLHAAVRDGLETKVLFLATSVDSGLVYDLIAAGAGGYLDKGSPADEICDAIVGVARGRTMLSRAVEGGVIQQIRVRGAGEESPLTPREMGVLRLVADGMSAPQVARELTVEASTVKSHLRNIYETLGVSDRAAAVAEGMRRGLLE